MLKAVFFDVGSTLVYDHGFRERLVEEIASSLEEHGIEPPPPARILEAWQAQPWPRREELEYWDLLKAMFALRNMGLKPTPSLAEDVYRHVLHAYRRGFRLDPDAPRVLEEVREMGLLVGIISNVGNYEIVSERFETLGLKSLVDVLVASQATVWKKPSPHIFEMAAHLAGVEPGEAVYVGDNPQLDIEPAKKLGMKAIQVLKAAPAKSPLADAWVETVAQVPPIVKSWL